MVSPHILTAIELAVIALSRSDRASSLRRQNDLSRFIFGQRTNLRLADPRLEALRRYAILLRLHGAALPRLERERLCDAGYDDRQIGEIHRLVAPLLREEADPRTSTCTQPRACEQPPTGPNPPEYRTSNSYQPASTVFRGPKTVRLSMRYLPKTRTQLAASTALLSIVFWHSTAPAQTDPVLEIEPQSQIEEPEQNSDHYIVGAGAAYAPAYLGADKYRVQPVPVVDVAWGPFFLNLRNGLGINVIDNDVLTVGVSVAPMQGYRREDAPEGIGKLSLGVGGRGFVSVKAAGFIATVGGTQGITGGTKGFVADASLTYPIAISSRFTLAPSIGATWANRKHNDRYFGVNEQQSLASGLPQFHAGSGFTDATAALSANYRLTDRISLGVTGAVTTLLGDVKDSPIVYHKTQPAGFLSITYRLGS